jgi:hypothetical protein
MTLICRIHEPGWRRALDVQRHLCLRTAAGRSDALVINRTYDGRPDTQCYSHIRNYAVAVGHLNSLENFFFILPQYIAGSSEIPC